MGNQYFSKEGLEKLKEELQHRTDVLRPEIAQRIKEAKEQGDLTENAEFDAAKEAQSMNEGRIEGIRKILESAVIIKEGGAKHNIVGIGCTVEVESSGKRKKFVIVGVTESDPSKGLISNESPIGKALLGRKKGDVIKVSTPNGEMEYKIIDIK